MSSSKKVYNTSDLSELSREELYSMINQMKENEKEMNEKICLLETQLNQYKNESKKCRAFGVSNAGLSNAALA